MMVNQFADIKLGYSCNDKCIHCVVEKLRDEALQNKKFDLKTDEYKQEILSAKSNGSNVITLTGGEPTIRRDFIDLVHFIKDNNLKIHLQSNGRKLSNSNFFNSVKDYIDFYEIALHGPSSKIHDLITQTSGAFDETIQGIKNIVSSGNKVYGKIVISKLNYKFLKDTLKLYKELEVNCVIMAFPHSSGEVKYIEKVAPSYETLKPYLQEALDYFKDDKDFLVTLENVMPCALDKEYNIKHYLDFFDNFKQVNLKLLHKDTQDWNSLKKNIKKKNTFCSKCIYDRWCDGYWQEYVKVYGFSGLNPVENIQDKSILDLKNLISWINNN